MNRSIEHSHNEGPLRLGVIAWFISNPVAANLLMTSIIVVGLDSWLSIQRVMFPAMDIPIINITIVYPAAAPEEVELGVVLKVEEALRDLEGIVRIASQAEEALATFFIQPADGYEQAALMEDIKNRIYAIDFPDQAEYPLINRYAIQDQVLMLQVWGELDEWEMQSLANELRLELTSLPEVSMVEVRGKREYEVSIEISEQKLHEFNLTLGEVAG